MEKLRTMKSVLNSTNHERVTSLAMDPYLFLALTIGSLLRFYNLDGLSIWLDESYSINLAQLTVQDIFFLKENIPPLYQAFLHFWIHIFGTSEAVVRFPSALFGAISIFATYRIGCLLFSLWTGRLSALLIATSVFHIQYSQIARCYTLAALMAILSMYFFIAMLSNLNAKNLVLYVISSTLLIYSHTYGMFILAAQNVYFIILSFLSKESRRCDARVWIISQCVIAILFAPWVRILMSQVKEVQKGFWIARPDMQTLLDTFKTYSSTRLLLLLFILFSACSAIYLKISHRVKLNWRCMFRSLEQYRWQVSLRDIDKICLLLLWLFVPIVVPFIISRFSQPIFFTRYTIVASVALYLLAARGIDSIGHKYAKLAVIMCVSALSVMRVGAYYAEFHKEGEFYKEEWRDVASLVDASSQEGDIVIFKSYECILPFDYYSRNSFLIKRGIRNSVRWTISDVVVMKHFMSKDSNSDVIVDEDNAGKMLESLGQDSRIWLILCHSEPVGENGEQPILKTFSKFLELSFYRRYPGIQLYLFDSRRHVKEGECARSGFGNLNR